MPATDEREKRAQSRQTRRSSGAKPKTAVRESKKTESPESSGGPASGSGGKPGRGTAILVLAGAGAGALAGTLGSLRKRRRERQPEDVEPEESGREEGDHDRGTSRREDASAEKPSGSNGASGTFRGMAITVLEAALDGLKDVGESGERDEADDGEPEASSADEDDEEEDHVSRGEQGGAGREPRGATADEDDEDDGRPPEAVSEPDEPDHELEPDDEGEDQDARDEGGDGDARPASGNGRHESPSIDLVRRAREQLAELVGRAPESVSHLEHRDDGWQLGLEVVELERIPNSTDVLASYEVTLDDDGQLLEYARTRRYVRSRSEEEGLS